jgi:hypothetical protein
MKAPNPLHKLITVHQPHPLPMMHVPPLSLFLSSMDQSLPLWWRSTTKVFCLPPLLCPAHFFSSPIRAHRLEQRNPRKNIFRTLTNPAKTTLFTSCCFSATCSAFCSRNSLFQCHPTDSSLAYQESSKKGNPSFIAHSVQSAQQSQEPLKQDLHSGTNLAGPGS